MFISTWTLIAVIEPRWSEYNLLFRTCSLKTVKTDHIKKTRCDPNAMNLERQNYKCNKKMEDLKKKID
jgi:hypothetical protein